MSLREDHPHRLIQSIPGIYFYESTPVKSPRKSFVCDSCGETIKAGTMSKNVFKFYDENGYWPTLEVCQGCLDDPKVSELIGEITAGDWDIDQ